MEKHNTKNINLVIYMISFVSFFLSQRTFFLGFSFLLFGIIFFLNKRINDQLFNSHMEYILTNILIFVLISFLTGGFIFLFLIAYMAYKFWIGINKNYHNQIIAFEYF